MPAPVRLYEIEDDMLRPHWRGMQLPDLLCHQQYYHNQLIEHQKYYGNMKPGTGGYQYRQMLSKCIKDIDREFARREKPVNVDSPNQRNLQAIKERCDLPTLIEQYTEVYKIGGTWKYRCRLHGQDTNPSGAIYNDGHWHCFGCNKGGDCFDFIQAWEFTDLSNAIRILCKFTGID